MQRDKLLKIHQIVLGVALGLAFIITVEALSAIHDRVHIRLHGADESRWSMTLRDGRDRIEVSSRGDVELVEEGARLDVELGPGARFELDAKQNGVRRQLEMRAGGAIDYRVDGRRRPYDDAARLWLSSVLVEVSERGGFDG